jgi:hypothetical protein
MKWCSATKDFSDRDGSLTLDAPNHRPAAVFNSLRALLEEVEDA